MPAILHSKSEAVHGLAASEASPPSCFLIYPGLEAKALQAFPNRADPRLPTTDETKGKC